MKNKFYMFFLSLFLVYTTACSDTTTDIEEETNIENNGDDNSEDEGDGTEDENNGGNEEIPNAPAFPGAEGFARWTTTGGRGGEVYVVTNLDDSGEGSLRYGLEKNTPRIIVFDVAGTIELKSTLRVRYDNVTIAGQTAPGDGICLKNYALRVDADNVIVRFLRCRMGDEVDNEDDAMWGVEQKNVIIDHCTMSWSTDECSSFYDNENFTMQWCILSESLRNSVHSKSSHGYGGIWGGQGASFHHNLLAHHDSRNPRLCGSRYTGMPDLELVDIRNNVFYNWGSNSGYAGEGGSYNFINNYYKPGPMTAQKSSVVHRIFEAYGDDGSNKNEAGIWGVFHLAGNYFDGTCSYITNNTAKNNIISVNNSNWNGLHNKGNVDLPEGGEEALRSYSAFSVADVTTHTAEEAYEKVLAYAGASYNRDAIDTRIVNEVKSGTYSSTGSNGSEYGLIDSQKDVEGYIYSHTTRVDGHTNGIEDSWAAANIPAGKAYNDLDPATGYSYIELYINSLVEDIMKAGSTVGSTVAEDFR